MERDHYDAGFIAMATESRVRKIFKKDMVTFKLQLCRHRISDPIAVKTLPL